MAKQETSKGINEKLLLIQGELSAIKRTNVNPHFKKSYADINQILSDVKPILTAHGVIISQPILEGKVWTIITDATSGETVSSAIELSMGLKPQEVGSAITYFRRYTLASLLALETEEDDDANKTMPKQPVQPINPMQPTPEIAKKPELIMYKDVAKTELTENFNKVVEALKSKKATVTQVKTRYTLTNEMESLLTDVQNG